MRSSPSTDCSGIDADILNRKMGGFGIDFKVREQRSAGDAAALANSYRSGSMNMANNYGQRRNHQLHRRSLP